MELATLTTLAGIVEYAVPVLFASIGENITEKAGITNLSVNGTIILSAMGGFVVSLNTQSIFLGFLTGALIGAAVAAIVAFSSITLKQSQVAIGFILALLCRDLGYFLGAPYTNKPGLFLSKVPIPGLSEIPILGPIFFNHSLVVYASYLFIIIAFVYMYKTRPGLMLQGIGERPTAAFARGANVKALRYFYTILGGALVGLAGPMYSLAVKIGWAGQLSGLDGVGWIALAITIFGGWNPLRVAFGAYLFGGLQQLGITLQSTTNIPIQILQAAPFPLMIFTLLLVNVGRAEWVERELAAMPEKPRKVLTRILRALRTSPPASMGIPFENE
ncbi:MAG: ABC transporter permease [Anaerolineaceae bacterium]|jgi:simple sugar transport system permease protein